MSDKWIIVSLQLKYVKRLAVDKNQINHPLVNKKWFLLHRNALYRSAFDKLYFIIYISTVVLVLIFLGQPT